MGRNRDPFRRPEEKGETMFASSSLRLWKVLVVLPMLMGFAGCTHYIAAPAIPMKPGMVPEFTGSGPIVVNNVQNATGQILIGANNEYNKFTASLSQFSDQAKGLLETELKKRNVNVAFEGGKRLNLAVTRVNLLFGFGRVRCVLSLVVETGDGYTHEYVGNNASPAGVYRACGGAITRAVAAMLNDESILAYLRS